MLESIGITEYGDAGIDLRWVDKIDEHIFCILITKKLTDACIENICRYNKKIILHLTCTGYGNTALEPNAYPLEKTYEQYKKLISRGFNPKQCVLRIDPIWPTREGFDIVKKVIETFKDTDIHRIRFSFIDRHPSIVEDMKSLGYPFAWDTFNPPKELMSPICDIISNYPQFVFESCAEPVGERVGCVSRKDYEILGIPFNDIKNGKRRDGCLCLGNKTELLIPVRHCAIGCGYCFLKEGGSNIPIIAISETDHMKN